MFLMKTQRTKPMTNKNSRASANPSITAKAQITESPYGNPTPEIEVTIPNRMSYRQLKAVLYSLAMDIEELTPSREGWITEIEVLADGRGRVYLELLKADAAEAARGLELLHEVAAKRGAQR